MFKDISAGQFDQQLLAEANKAIRNGDVSRRELDKLKQVANADGQISEDEQLLLANLDNGSVQAALRDAVEPRSLGIRRFDFDQEVSFSLNTEDLTLKVGDTQVNLADDIAHIETRRELRFDFGRRSDNVRQEVVAGLDGSEGSSFSNVGINNVTRATQNASGAGELIRTALEAGKGQSVDLSSIENLNVDQGLNLTYSLIIAKASQVTQSENYGKRAKALEELNDVKGIIKDIERGKAPNAKEIQQLQQLGLDFKEGQLINTVTKQALTPAEMADLRLTLHSVDKAFRGLRLFDENKLTLQVLQQIQVSQTALDQLEEARKKALAAEQQVNQNRQQVDQSSQSYTDQELVVNQRRQELEQKKALVEPILALLQGNDGQTNLDQLQNLLKNLSSQQLAALNEMLGAYQLSISLDANHNLSFSGNGASLSATDFYSRLRPNLPAMQASLESAQQAFDQSVDELTRRQQRLAQDQLKLNDSIIAFEEASRIFDQAKKDADQAIADLNELTDDPAVLNLLPQDTRAQINQLRERHRSESEQYNQALERREPTLNAARQSLRKGQQILNNWKDFLAGVNELRGKSGKSQTKAITPNANPAPSLAPYISELIEQANDLQSRLTLLPAPIYTGVEDLLAEFEEILQTSRLYMDQLNADETSRSDLNRHLSREHLEDTKEELVHHQNQLAALDQHNKELVTRYLEAGLASYQQLMQAA